MRGAASVTAGSRRAFFAERQPDQEGGFQSRNFAKVQNRPLPAQFFPMLLPNNARFARSTTSLGGSVMMKTEQAGNGNRRIDGAGSAA
jgi:hypothetical protein